jgi:hypothetical protein
VNRRHPALPARGGDGIASQDSVPEIEMPDERRHRGRHPADDELFAERHRPALRAAVADLSWLLDRGYAENAALQLVGDRHGLRARQRLAARRCACSDAQRLSRRERTLPLDTLDGRPVAIDGFNCLITLEAAFSGGVLLRGRDGALRDLASVHGSYRQVEETSAAIVAVGRLLAGRSSAEVRWYLDRPVSNSGRLRAHLLEMASAHAWPWTVCLLDAPDRMLAASGAVVATSDSWILDRCRSWVDLPAAILASGPMAIVDLDVDLPGPPAPAF